MTKRCSHVWVVTHEPSEWTQSGYSITQTCECCGARSGVDPATHAAYVREHNL